jgi:hypothetical protein
MNESRKECFGILDRVFPTGREGLREVVPECFDCPLKTACLKAALYTKEGIAFRTEKLDRTPHRGLAGRVKRWSEKKHLERLKKYKEAKK